MRCVRLTVHAGEGSSLGTIQKYEGFWQHEKLSLAVIHQHLALVLLALKQVLRLNLSHVKARVFWNTVPVTLGPTLERGISC